MVIFSQAYWKLHEDFYDKTLEEYNHPSGVPMNWDGRRYDVPELGFKKTVCGVILTIYGVIIMTLGATLLLVIKYIPVHLNAIFLYLKTLTEMFTCVAFPFLPFWLIGLALVIGGSQTSFNMTIFPQFLALWSLFLAS